MLHLHGEKLWSVYRPLPPAANATRAAAAAAELGGTLGGGARWRATGAVLCGRFASVAAVNVG